MWSGPDLACFQRRNNLIAANKVSRTASAIQAVCVHCALLFDARMWRSTLLWKRQDRPSQKTSRTVSETVQPSDKSTRHRPTECFRKIRLAEWDRMHTSTRLMVLALPLLQHQPLPPLAIPNSPQCLPCNRILCQTLAACLLLLFTLMLMELAPLLLSLRPFTPRQHRHQLEQESLRQLTAQRNRKLVVLVRIPVHCIHVEEVPTEGRVWR